MNSFNIIFFLFLFLFNISLCSIEYNSTDNETENAFENEELYDIEYKNTILLHTNKSLSELQEVFQNPTYAAQLKQKYNNTNENDNNIFNNDIASNGKENKKNNKLKNRKKKHTHIVRTFRTGNGNFTEIIDKFNSEDLDDDDLLLDDFKVKSSSANNLSNNIHLMQKIDQPTSLSACFSITILAMMAGIIIYVLHVLLNKKNKNGKKYANIEFDTSEVLLSQYFLKE